MDNTINSTIIEKVIIKSVAIYKAMDMLSQPPFEDKFKKETLCQQNENTQKQNSEKCLNEPEKRIEQPQNVDTNETKIVNEPENLNTTTQIKSGIYKIINKVNGKYYVGSTKDFHKRWKYYHLRDLRLNTHCNHKLQQAWNKYGSDAFEFVVVEYVNDLNNLLLTEQKYLDIAKNECRRNYNIAYDTCSPSKGRSVNVGNKHCVNRRLSKESYLKRGQTLKSTYQSNPDLLESIKNRCIKFNKSRMDWTVYKFINVKTNESFQGYRYDFTKKYNVKRHFVTDLIKRKHIGRNGWTINNPA